MRWIFINVRRLEHEFILKKKIASATRPHTHTRYIYNAYFHHCVASRERLWLWQNNVKNIELFLWHFLFLDTDTFQSTIEMLNKFFDRSNETTEYSMLIMIIIIIFMPIAYKLSIFEASLHHLSHLAYIKICMRFLLIAYRENFSLMLKSNGKVLNFSILVFAKCHSQWSKNCHF